jgi:hypothetical protein
MSREVRRVHKDWIHPEGENGRAHKPLYEGYSEDKENFLELLNAEGLQEALDNFGSAPDINDYMPEWEESEKTHLMMYETTSEGTPISPAFETPEELAQWLVDNNASAFGRSTGSYEGWLRVAMGGYAPSMIITDGVMKTGVDAI